jgi:NYN domain/OST-HTH/LOTUS domain
VQELNGNENLDAVRKQPTASSGVVSRDESSPSRVTELRQWREIIGESANSKSERKEPMEKTMLRLAVLIDAENAQLAILGNLLAEIAKIGSASVKRVYGDFTCPALATWREQLLAHSIQPIQQFRNTVHKNASDSALIIDAMDLVHSKRFDGFCIVSSDSDFTRLASRIREEGLLVYGFGEEKTPTSFIAACDKFIYTEVLRNSSQAPPASGQVHKDALRRNAELMHRLVDAVESCADESGWASLGTVGSVVVNHMPSFDPRHYGFKKLSALVEATGLFDIQKRGNEESPLVFVRLKPEGSAAHETTHD